MDPMGKEDFSMISRDGKEMFSWTLWSPNLLPALLGWKKRLLSCRKWSQWRSFFSDLLGLLICSRRFPCCSCVKDPPWLETGTHNSSSLIKKCAKKRPWFFSAMTISPVSIMISYIPSVFFSAIYAWIDRGDSSNPPLGWGIAGKWNPHELMQDAPWKNHKQASSLANRHRWLWTKGNPGNSRRVETDWGRSAFRKDLAWKLITHWTDSAWKTVIKIIATPKKRDDRTHIVTVLRSRMMQDPGCAIVLFLGVAICLR